MHWLHHGLHQGLAFIALVFPAIAASLVGLEAHREHLRLEKRSANMGPQLERLNRQMASASDPERFESLLQQVDEIMLRETQDWLMLMRYVEIKASWAVNALTRPGIKTLLGQSPTGVPPPSKPTSSSWPSQATHRCWFYS